jgi:phage terminase large subunit-like protein
VFKSELATARDVRDGLVKLPRLAVLYELPEEVAKDGGWKNERTWPLVNPNLGRSVDEVFLRNSLITAERDGPEAMALLASQHFNVEIGLALRSDAWAGAKYWLDAVDPALTLEELIARSEVAVVGIDGGGLDDLMGLAVIGRCKVTRDWLFWAHAWAQTDVFERRKEIASKLRDFITEGTLTLCEGDPTQDAVEAAEIVIRLKDAKLLPDKHAVGLDPVGVAAMVDELASRASHRRQPGLSAFRCRLGRGAQGQRRDVLARRVRAHVLGRRQRQSRAARERGADHQAGGRQSEDRPADRRL